MRKGFVIASDETPIFYEVSGRSTGSPTLIFCDGAGCDGYIWKYLHGSLQSDYRLIHFHYRGHGKSARPRDIRTLSIPQLADDLSLVLDACETPSAVVFGHSMGVQVALESYRRHSNRVQGLVLLCGTHSHPLRTFRGKSNLEGLLPFMQMAVGIIPRVSNFLWSKLVPSMLSYKLATRIEINGRLVRVEDFSPFFDGVARIDVRLLLATLRAAGKHNASDMLKHIQVPTLIVAGERDSFTPLHLSKEMHHHIPNSELVVVQDGTHAAAIEHPIEISSKVMAFLNRKMGAFAV